jgi:D-alanyl-D-alanine carboxypeptidase
MAIAPYVPGDPAADPDSVEGRLQQILDDAVNEYGLPAAQVGVQLPDGRRVVVASGTPDFGRKEPPIDVDAMIRIGSATKMFVAALIGRQAERGLLSFDDPVARWLPDLVDAGEITLRQLLSHRSGVPENLFTNASILMRTGLSPRMRWDPEEVVRRVVKRTSAEGRRQARFEYANPNYLILGLVAERVGGAPVGRQLETEFFSPLGMTHTALLPEEPSNPQELIQGYDRYMPLGPHRIEPEHTSWDSLTHTAGAMASTAGDLLIWLDALFHGRVVEPATLREMESFQDSRNNGRDNGMVGYGLGLSRYELEDWSLVGHPGGGFGGECFPFYLPGRDTSVVVSYNLSRKDNPAGKAVLARVIREIVEPETAP